MSLDREATSRPKVRPGARALACLLVGLALIAAPAVLRANGDSAALRSLAERPLLTIVAENAEGSARLELSPSDYTIDQGILSWRSAERVSLRDPRSGVEIARLEQVSLTYVADPSISLTFIATAGGAPTTFTLTSGELSFPGLADARGRASAGLTATDDTGDGALLTGLNPDGQIFQGFYNDAGGVPASGSSFATLVSGLPIATSYTSNAVAEDFPVAPGLSATAEGGATLGTVSSMSTRFHFQLSAGDSASGSSVFVVEPLNPPDAITLGATSAVGSARLDLPLSSSRSADGARIWTSSQATALTDAATGVEIGRLEAGSSVQVADHIVIINFSLSSGASPVVFSITSASISFPAVANAFAHAGAALSITDIGGDGATLTGTNGDAQAYQAYYNDIGGVPATGATFATLVDGLSVATPYSTAATASGFGAAGAFSAVAEGGATLGSVSSLSVRWTLSVGAFDTVAATSILALHPGGTVSGRVYQDNDGDGSQGAGEPGLAGVDVVITDSQAGVWTVTTDGNGDYGRALPAGSTSLDVDETTLPAGAVQTEGTDPTVVVVPEGGGASDVDGYQVLGTLSARVFEDANGNGVQDALEPGLPGIDLVITDSLAAAQTLTTDANGDVSAVVPAGSTTVDVDDTTLPANMVLTAGTDPAVVAVVAGADTLVLFGYRFLPVQAIPTLDALGLALLALALALAGARFLARRRGGARAG
jgi:hypothetical protein